MCSAPVSPSFSPVYISLHLGSKGKSLLRSCETGHLPARCTFELSTLAQRSGPLLALLLSRDAHTFRALLPNVRWLWVPRNSGKTRDVDLSLCLIAFPPWSPGLIPDLTVHPGWPGLGGQYTSCFILARAQGQSAFWAVAPER